MPGLIISAAVFETRESYDAGPYGYVRLRPSITLGGSVRYLLPSGLVRPFAEVGGWTVPDSDLEFRRAYTNGAGVAVGISRPDSDLSYFYSRIGLVARLGQLADLTIAGEIGRERLGTGAFGEALSRDNPFEATFTAGRDRFTVAKGQLAVSRDLSAQVGFSLWGAYARTFDRTNSVEATIPGIGTLGLTGNETEWFEYGGSVSFRFAPNASIAVFGTGISGNRRTVGSQTHGGIAVRMGF
jgi:hypothetical protein